MTDNAPKQSNVSRIQCGDAVSPEFRITELDANVHNTVRVGARATMSLVVECDGSDADALVEFAGRMQSSCAVSVTFSTDRGPCDYDRLTEPGAGAVKAPDTRSRADVRDWYRVVCCPTCDAYIGIDKWEMAKVNCPGCCAPVKLFWEDSYDAESGEEDNWPVCELRGISERCDD